MTMNFGLENDNSTYIISQLWNVKDIKKENNMLKFYSNKIMLFGVRREVPILFKKKKK